MWDCVLTRIRFKCTKCSVGLCVNPSFRVFHTELQFWDQFYIGKSRLHNGKFHLSLGNDIFWIQKYCYITGVRGCGFYETHTHKYKSLAIFEVCRKILDTHMQFCSCKYEKCLEISLSSMLIECHQAKVGMTRMMHFSSGA